MNRELDVIFQYDICNPHLKKLVDPHELTIVNEFEKRFADWYIYMDILDKNRSEAQINVSGRLSSDQVDHQLANIHQITFETTERCNLNCKYCGYGDFYEDYDRRENLDGRGSLRKLLVKF